MAQVLSMDDWLLAKADAEVERILAMSDEEVIAECRRDGIDPEVTAAQMQMIVRKVLGERLS